MGGTGRVALGGLAQRLVQDGLLDEQAMQDALVRAKEKRVNLVTHLVATNLATARDIAISASNEFGVPLLDLDAVAPDLDAVRAVSDKLLHKHRVLPLMKRGKRLFLAVADPTNLGEHPARCKRAMQVAHCLALDQDVTSDPVVAGGHTKHFAGCGWRSDELPLAETGEREDQALRGRGGKAKVLQAGQHPYAAGIEHEADDESGAVDDGYAFRDIDRAIVDRDPIVAGFESDVGGGRFAPINRLACGGRDGPIDRPLDDAAVIGEPGRKLQPLAALRYRLNSDVAGCT
jgi:hypothetical protein